MAYEVLARKWRPKQLADVIGQDHVTRTLQHAIESNRVAHAYLFVGPRGIGKTSLSRIFAKALNCEHGPTPVPCDQCDICREIMAGNSLDVMEIDAASNTGVENIRGIRDAVQFAPARARFKIYIIDEVHMLSTGAFNALLKTLEEPPPHVKFIFATTEVDKLPATIISRCQRFNLRRISTSTIVEYLSRISASEGVTADNDALLAIARGAEGGMRDALGALDQIISFKGNQVSEADVLAVFGLVSREQLESLATAILRGDMAAGLKIIDDLDHGGKDLRRLTVELMEHFRNLLVRQQLGAAASSALDVTPEQLATLDEQAKLADSGRILRITEHLVDLEGKIRYALSRRTLFETVFLRCCRAATVVSLDRVIQQLSNLKAGLPVVRPAVIPHGASEPRSVVQQQVAPAPVVTNSPTRKPVESQTQEVVPPPRVVQHDNPAPRPARPALSTIPVPKTVKQESPKVQAAPKAVQTAHEPSENVKAALKLFNGSVAEYYPPKVAEPADDSDFNSNQ